MARYGPKENMPTNMEGDFFEDQDKWEKENEARVEKQAKEFAILIQDIIDCPTPEQLPAIVSSRMDLILNLRGYEGINLFQQTIQQAERSGNEQYLEDVEAACDYILSFTEEFVDQAKEMDDVNKNLLGKIVKQISSSNDDSLSEIERERALDDLLQTEKKNFTPGFLRHIEGECTRIQTAPKISKESIKLLETLRLIQTRVVEELGKDLGEGAQILGQLLGYDDQDERIAVLEAGLTVRGLDFAQELADLTTEALDGFAQIPKDEIDPELVSRVSELKDCIVNYIEERSSWE